MKDRKFSIAELILLLLPLLGAVMLFVPALNPGRYISFTADWTYPQTLKDAMLIDQLFTKAFPGMQPRPLFASNALLTFCTFALGVMVAIQVLGALLSLVMNKLVTFISGTMTLVGSGASLLLGGLSIFGAISAQNTADTLRVAAEYMVPVGSVLLALEGLAAFVLFFIVRRQRMIAEKTYIRMTRREIRENLKGYAFISPYLIGFCVFTAFPLAFSAFSSFTYYNITAVQKWYGLTNFTKLFADDLFWKSLGNTLYYVVFSVPSVIVLAMILALLMNQRVKFMGFFRTIYYLPSVLSGVAVYLLWQWIFDPSNGLLNNGLALLGIEGPAWLYDAKWTKPAMIIMRLWSTGGTMILLLAALQNVPQELYEAGEIDGAVGLRKFFNITLPMISPTLFFVMVTGISGAFQVYDSAYIMVENGGPSKSLMFYNLYLFTTAFKDQAMGKASAMAWILFAIIMFFTVVQQQASKKWVYYDGGTDK